MIINIIYFDLKARNEDLNEQIWKNEEESESFQQQLREATKRVGYIHYRIMIDGKVY